MRTLRRWLLVVGMVGPSVVNLSCSGTVLVELRDAAVGAATTFIADTTTEILNQIFDSINTGG